MTVIKKEEFIFNLRIATLVAIILSTITTTWTVSHYWEKGADRVANYDRVCTIVDSVIVPDVTNLKNWKQKVQAYYGKPENRSVTQTVTESKTSHTN